MRTVQPPDSTLFQGDGSSRIGTCQEKADLAECLAWAKVAQHLLTTVEGELHYLYPAGLNTVEASIGLALEKDDGAGPIFMPGGEIDQTLKGAGRKSGKVGQALQLGEQHAAIGNGHTSIISQWLAGRALVSYPSTLRSFL